MARPFMFAALCQHAHPLKHSLAESEKQQKKSSLAEKFFSGVTRQVSLYWQNSATERSLSHLEHLQFMTQFKVPLILASSVSVHPWHYNCLVQILCQGTHERFPHLVLSHMGGWLQVNTLLLSFLFKILNCMHITSCDLCVHYPTIYFLHCKSCAGRHVILFEA